MSQRIEIELDDQGRLVLPAPLRDQLGLVTGMILVVEHATPEATYVRVQSESPRLLDQGGILVVDAQPVGDIAEFIRAEREQRVTDLVHYSIP